MAKKKYVANISDLTPNPAQGSEDLRMIHLSEHDSRNVCGHYEAGDTGGVKPPNSSLLSKNRSTSTATKRYVLRTTASSIL